MNTNDNTNNKNKIPCAGQGGQPLCNVVQYAGDAKKWRRGEKNKRIFWRKKISTRLFLVEIFFDKQNKTLTKGCFGLGCSGQNIFQKKVFWTKKISCIHAYILHTHTHTHIHTYTHIVCVCVRVCVCVCVCVCIHAYEYIIKWAICTRVGHLQRTATPFEICMMMWHCVWWRDTVWWCDTHIHTYTGVPGHF